MTYVSYFGARMFAHFYDLDLPTNIQWEYAAAGPNGHEYPGDITPECDVNSWCGTSEKQLADEAG